MLKRLPRIRHKPRIKKAFASHRRFLRDHVCIVPDCTNTFIQVCHIRSNLPEGEQAGTGQKPHDAWTFPACLPHHQEQHELGEQSFEKKYGIDLLKTAFEFAFASPVMEVRQHARKVGQR